MSTCVNRNDPRYKELLKKYKNPLIAEVEFKSLYPEIDFLTNNSESIKKVIDDLNETHIEKINKLQEYKNQGYFSTNFQKPIKEGVAEIFEENPELVLIGTAQEYSDYLDIKLDSIMKGSKEDILNFKQYMEFKNNAKDYFNLTEKDSNFVSDLSNLNFTC